MKLYGYCDCGKCEQCRIFKDIDNHLKSGGKFYHEETPPPIPKQKLYQKLESASFPILDDLILEIDSGYILISEYDDGKYECSEEITEQKLIELRNFINSLLEEQE